MSLFLILWTLNVALLSLAQQFERDWTLHPNYYTTPAMHLRFDCYCVSCILPPRVGGSIEKFWHEAFCILQKYLCLCSLIHLNVYLCVPQSLLRSPEVISFLQQQQQLLATQSRSQSQQQFQGCWRRPATALPQYFRCIESTEETLTIDA